MTDAPDVAVVGAGPAGLTAAYLLAKTGARVVVLEAHESRVGGISRTEEWRGFRFDIGGHRFFSKSKAVEALWDELLPRDMLVRPRSSRIYYRGRFYSYPLKPFEAFRNLGPVESARCVSSYARARLRPIRDPRNFEDWVSNQFGHRLFSIFFKTYTEKVWGMSCREISADWAAQRIRGLSLASALRHALPRRRAAGPVVKTLIESFRYPRLGPGMMWDAAAARVRELGGEVRLGCRVAGLAWDQQVGKWSVSWAGGAAGQGSLIAREVISSAALRDVVLALEPAPAAALLEAARGLRYRDFLTVALIARDRGIFADNWIYIHDAGVRVGRIQNFKAWSPEMVPDPALACYGLEYFCNEGDRVWSLPDGDLVALARREMSALGLAAEADVLDGCVVRQVAAYPVYDADYASRVGIIRATLERDYPGLHVVGRNGMHKYNNQDHAMMTAMLTVENILAGERRYDVWRVNQDAEYHEEGAPGAGGGASGLRAVPVAVSR